jgi:hypothetical protein
LAVDALRRYPGIHRPGEQSAGRVLGPPDVLSPGRRRDHLHDGIVDKFVGDEAIGLFIPGFTGRDHAAKAIAAGRALLAAAGRSDASSNGPIPVGAGIHTGIAYVGSLGSSEQISDFTALGDPVNTTARLASLARAGELLISVEAGERASLDATGLERRTVEVRGGRDARRSPITRSRPDLRRGRLGDPGGGVQPRSITDRMLPAGSLNQAIRGGYSVAMPRSSWAIPCTAPSSPRRPSASTAALMSGTGKFSTVKVAVRGRRPG